MKKSSIRKFSGAVLCAVAVSISPMASAQTSVTTTTTGGTTTSVGTISEFTPGSQIIVRGESATPMTYSVGKTVTYVDEAGAPVSAELVKSGLPVTVHYVKEGDRMIANKVVVRKTTTTTSSPVIEKQSKTTTTTKTQKEDD